MSRINNERLEVMRAQLINALAIMDESGREIPGNSTALWSNYWHELRNLVFLAYNELDQHLTSEIVERCRE